MAAETVFRRNHNFKDITGQRFGRWTVIGEDRSPRLRKVKWLCRCDCGNERAVYADNLQMGYSRSCGCLKNEVAADRLTKHGMKGTPEYRCWKGIKERCTNKAKAAYPRYGGRGIEVCDRWLHSFENFYADMGPKPSRGHSIERINNNGHYEPDNCRWATSAEQNRNRRNNRMITMTLAEAVELTGVPYHTAKSRLLRGWSVRDALANDK